MRRRRPVVQMDVGDESPSMEGSVEDIVAAGERAERVAEAMAQLPSPQLEVVQLAYFGELSQSEIAERLGLPLGTSRAGSGSRSTGCVPCSRKSRSR